VEGNNCLMECLAFYLDEPVEKFTPITTLMQDRDGSWVDGFVQYCRKFKLRPYVYDERYKLEAESNWTECFDGKGYCIAIVPSEHPNASHAILVHEGEVLYDPNKELKEDKIVYKEIYMIIRLGMYRYERHINDRLRVFLSLINAYDPRHVLCAELALPAHLHGEFRRDYKPLGDIVVHKMRNVVVLMYELVKLDISLEDIYVDIQEASDRVSRLLEKPKLVDRFKEVVEKL